MPGTPPPQPLKVSALNRSPSSTPPPAGGQSPNAASRLASSMLTGANAEFFHRYEVEEGKARHLRAKAKLQEEQINELAAELQGLETSHAEEVAQRYTTMHNFQTEMEELQKEEAALEAETKATLRAIQSNAMAVSSVRLQLAHNFQIHGALAKGKDLEGIDPAEYDGKPAIHAEIDFQMELDRIEEQRLAAEEAARLKAEEGTMAFGTASVGSNSLQNMPDDDAISSVSRGTSLSAARSGASRSFAQDAVLIHDGLDDGSDDGNTIDSAEEDGSSMDFHDTGFADNDRFLDEMERAAMRRSHAKRQAVDHVATIMLLQQARDALVCEAQAVEVQHANGKIYTYEYDRMIQDITKRANRAQEVLEAVKFRQMERDVALRLKKKEKWNEPSEGAGTRRVSRGDRRRGSTASSSKTSASRRGSLAAFSASTASNTTMKQALGAAATPPQDPLNPKDIAPTSEALESVRRDVKELQSAIAEQEQVLERDLFETEDAWLDALDQYDAEAFEKSRKAPADAEDPIVKYERKRQQQAEKREQPGIGNTSSTRASFIRIKEVASGFNDDHSSRRASRASVSVDVSHGERGETIDSDSMATGAGGRRHSFGGPFRPTSLEGTSDAIKKHRPASASKYAAAAAIALGKVDPNAVRSCNPEFPRPASAGGSGAIRYRFRTHATLEKSALGQQRTSVDHYKAFNQAPEEE